MLTVTYDADLQSLRAVGRRRTAITGARGALNGYQKGACFYCYSPVSTGESSAGQAQVDHVFAWSIGPEVGGGPVDGVWNLVLACARCNGWHEKSDEFLIASQHPLRPTLIAQTGSSVGDRAQTLRQAYVEATAGGVRSAWEAPEELDAAF